MHVGLVQVVHKMYKNNPLAISVFGCGNTLLGDDGFRPAVIARLEQESDFPGFVHLEDVGTGIRDYLFDFILDPALAPDMLIILDVVDFEGRSPGDVFIITPDAISVKKSTIFSSISFQQSIFCRNLLNILSRQSILLPLKSSLFRT